MSKTPSFLVWLSLLIFSLLLFTAGTTMRLPLNDWPALPLLPEHMSMDQIIVVYALLPRSAVALFAGAALGLSGAILQAVLRNPIADPSTLGISAGAQLAIVAATLFVPTLLDGHRELVAFMGSGVAAILVFALGAKRRFEAVTMIIAGMLIGITAGALSAALTLSQGEYLMSLAIWNGGSFSQQGWSSARSMGVQLCIYAVLTALIARPLIALDLGDSAAQSLGVPIALIRFMAALIAVGLSAMVSSAVGLVGFVGLAAPALARMTGARRRSVILFASPFMGALLVWFCDGVVQLVTQTSGASFPTGAVLALIGGPLIIVMLSRLKTASAAPAQTSARRSTSHASVFLSLAVVLLVLSGMSLFVARTGDGWLILSGSHLADILALRIPRIVAASAAGGLLALSGAILQRLTANPMASPEVLGVSSGAGVGYALTLTLFPAFGPIQLFAGSAVGALSVMVIVLLFALKRHLAAERLLLAGISVSAFGSSILAAFIAVGDQTAWQILSWMGGSASSATPLTATILAVMLAASLSAALCTRRWLTILPLGHAAATGLGLPMMASRICLILIASLATGAASMLVGPLSFVGLIAPHIVTSAGIVRSGSHMAATALIGAALMAIADFGARSVTFPYELPLGLFAAIIGAPYLIWLLMRRA